MIRKTLAKILVITMFVTGFCMLGNVGASAATKSDVYIGHATHDENGKIKGGEAGDQTK